MTNLFHPILQQQGETDGFREDQGTLICAVQAQGLKKIDSAGFAKNTCS